MCDEQEALYDALHEAIRRCLTAKQREVVRLYYFEGLTQDVIAARLGIRQQVVSKRLYGARRRGKPVGGAIARLKAVLDP